MHNMRTLNRDQAQIEVMRNMTKIYSELSSSRMNSIRSQVLHSRTFLESIYKIFDQVRESYAHELYHLSKRVMKKRGERLTLLAHNGKSVYVFLAANSKLYGNLLDSIFELFINDLRESKAEVVIVGRVGINMFLQDEPNRPYTHFEFPDTGTDSELVSKLVKHLVHYEKIRIYYAEFSNVVVQKPTYFELSAELPLPQEVQDGTDIPDEKYLFEPSLEEVLAFFEKEIFGALFNQTILESQLSKHAARLVAMDRAELAISERLKRLVVERLGLKHREANKKQLNAVGAIVRRQRVS